MLARAGRGRAAAAARLVETGRDGRETITPLGWAAVGLSAALPLAIVSALSAAQRQTARGFAALTRAVDGAGEPR